MKKNVLPNAERRFQIIIQQKTRTRQNDGGEVETWQTVRTTRARAVFKSPRSGENFEGDAQLVGTQTVEFDILKQSGGIDTADFRVLYDANYYDILQVHEWGLGMRYLKLICEKRDNE